MRIPCPFCGSRDVSEFTYLGDASVTRPALGVTDPAVWHAYAYLRENPRGRHREHWHHSSGCRAIVKVTRDVQSHVIADASLEGGWA